MQAGQENIEGMCGLVYGRHATQPRSQSRTCVDRGQQPLSRRSVTVVTGFSDAVENLRCDRIQRDLGPSARELCALITAWDLAVLTEANLRVRGYSCDRLVLTGVFSSTRWCDGGPGKPRHVCRYLFLIQLLSKGRDGGPGQSRTADLRFRKPLLYPSELRGRVYNQQLSNTLLKICRLLSAFPL